jgi:hypothetical protein
MSYRMPLCEVFADAVTDRPSMKMYGDLGTLQEVYPRARAEEERHETGSRLLERTRSIFSMAYFFDSARARAGVELGKQHSGK